MNGATGKAGSRTERVAARSANLGIALALAAWCLQSAFAGTAVPATSGVHAVTPRLGTSGALDADAVARAKAQGYEVIVDLRTRDEGTDEERTAVVAAGLDYENLPVPRAAPKATDLAAFSALMSAFDGRKVLVNCATGKRASVMVMLDRVTRLGVPVEAAREHVAAVWTPSSAWQKFIDDSIAAWRTKEDPR